MVTVKLICFVVLFFIQGSAINAQEEIPVEVPVTSAPKVNVVYDYAAAYDYGNYGYDYKQYGDYGKQYGDYQYEDYGGGYDYGNYPQYGYEDYGYYDDYETHYGDAYGFGDRNNPLDAIAKMGDDTGLGLQLPWVYIIVPVVQVDVFYIDDGEKSLTDLELQLPIETFLFELGDFGMAHFDLGYGGDYGFGDYGDDYGQYDYQYLGQYPYGQFDYDANPKANLYDPADELNDFSTLDYPGLDHDNYWVDWIFMIPQDEMGLPIVR